MSASRKKQLRKEAEEPVISSRAQEEMEKAARRKRNTIIYSIIGVVAAILVAALLIWDSGIIQRNTAVATIGDEKVTASQVAYHYYNNDIIYYSQLYSYYGFPSSYDASVSPREQVITEDAASEHGIDKEYIGLTYHEFFLDYALNTLRQEFALLDAAREAGYTLSDEGKTSVDETMAEMDSTRESYLSSYGADMSRTAYLQMVYGKSMNESKYRTCVENAVLAEEFYNQYFDTLTHYTDEELEAYYQDNTLTLDTIHYYYRYFDGQAAESVDADGNTVEPTEEEEAAALANAMSAAEAEQAAVNADYSIVADNDEYSQSYTTPTIGDFGYDWLTDDARQHGDTTILDSTYGFYLVVFDERYREDSHTVDVRHILVEAANEDDAATEDVDESTEAPTDEAFAAAEEKALELLEQWKSGEATEESFAALAEEHSADPGSNTNGGLYENVSNHKMIDNFNDWIFDPARQTGDVSEPILNTESSTQGWHIIYYVGQDEPAWMTAAREGKWNADLKANVEIVRKDSLESVFS